MAPGDAILQRGALLRAAARFSHSSGGHDVATVAVVPGGQGRSASSVQYKNEDF